MITKTLNFTVITGNRVTSIRAPDDAVPFSPDYGLEYFMFRIPRKIPYDAAVREAKKKYTNIVKDSVQIEYQQHEYQISIEEFVKHAKLIK